MVVDQIAADGKELFGGGHVGAGRDDGLGGGDVEVEPRTGGLLHSAAGPPGGDVRLVGTLVGGEARVAIDAEEGFVRWADVIGREGGHGGFDPLDERKHGPLELALVEVLARLEPGAIVCGAPARAEI